MGQNPTAALIVSACMDFTQKIGGMHRDCNHFVKACTGEKAIPQTNF